MSMPEDGGNLFRPALVPLSGAGGTRETACRKRASFGRQRPVPVRPVSTRLLGDRARTRAREHSRAALPEDEGGEPEGRRRPFERLYLGPLRVRLGRAALRLPRKGAARNGSPLRPFRGRERDSYDRAAVS